jgi:hypothetical protein
MTVDGDRCCSTTPKRSRPFSSEIDGMSSSSSTKKARRPRPHLTSHGDLSDNDENFHVQRKSTPSSSLSKNKPKLLMTINQTIQRKGNQLSADFHPDNLDCCCRRNDDLQEKFFVQCELCSRWLHGKCVGLTPRLAEKMREFTCDECAVLTQRAKERLYCICQRPYDDSK